MNSFIAQIRRSIEENIEVKQRLLNNHCQVIAQIALEMIQTLRDGNKIILFGNGGSAADAQHIAAELMGRFIAQRPSLPAIALTANTSTLTAIGNDFGYEYVFSRQVEGIANPGDLVIGISTSGKSPNVLRGIQAAKQMGIKTAAFVGANDGPIVKEADLSFIVPSHNTQRIQETHIMVGHILCELIEGALVHDSRENKIAARRASSCR